MNYCILFYDEKNAFGAAKCQFILVNHCRFGVEIHLMNPNILVSIKGAVIEILNTISVNAK
jgi:hypothetical protein